MQQRVLFQTLIIALFISLGSFPSWGAAPEQQAAVSQESQQKKQYENNMEERLRKLGKDLDELKAKTDAMTKQARRDMNQYLRAAEKKREAASRKLEMMRKESVATWKKLSAETDRAVADFEKAYEKAKSRFKE